MGSCLVAKAHALSVQAAQLGLVVNAIGASAQLHLDRQCIHAVGKGEASVTELVGGHLPLE